MGNIFSNIPRPPPPPPPSASIDVMSVYQPFPLRIDSFGEQGKQYDACFQIGEFPSKNIKGSRIVILVPLKVSSNTTGIGAKFVNAFANKIPNILGQQPDRLLGYPDVPAQTGADWSIAKVVKLDRPHYTWTQGDGTRVVVMAEPILIAEGDMENIKRLPVTPPEDVIHEIGSNIKYKPAPPVDANGNPVPCAPPRGSLPNIPITQPPVKVPAGSGVTSGNGVTSKSSFDPNLIWQVILGLIGTIAIVIGVWMGIKLAAGPGGDIFRKLGDSLGKQLAGAYKSVKNTKIPALPTPKSPSPAAPTETRTPEQIADIAPTTIPEPSGDFEMTNPLFKDKNDFITRHRAMTQRTKQARTTTRRNPIKTADKIAAAPAPPASTAAVIEPDADELLRRRRAERNRLAQPAGTGLFDLGNNPKPLDEIAQRKPSTPGFKEIGGPSETPAQKIARLANARKRTPKRRNIGPIEDDTPALAKTASFANRLKRASTRAKDSVSDFDKAIQNTPKKATIFDSPAARANYGISETRSSTPEYLATAKTVPRIAGRRRRHRLKTGRQV